VNAEDNRVVNLPYSVGVLLAVNALSDAWLLLDAPACAMHRPGFIQDSHDWKSTLWDAKGFHRVLITRTHPDELVKDPVRDIPGQLERIAAVPGCGAILAVGYPLVTLTGVQHDLLWRSLDPQPAKPFFCIRGGRLEEDWLDGYAETLLAIARGMDLGRPAPDPGRVALVGYPWDRNEGDHVANVAELRRLLLAMDLDVVAVWPSGGTVGELAAVSTAGTIVSMPHGREAAALLAERVGAQLVVGDLPFGLEATREWLGLVGEATGRADRARAVAETELAREVPRIALAVSRVLAGSTLAAFVDPNYLRPLARFVGDVGASLVLGCGRTGDGGMTRRGPWDDLPFPVMAAPSTTRMGEIGAGLSCDATVGRFEFSSLPFVELGFPSYFQHSLTDRPFLGFRGATAFLDRLVAVLLLNRHSRQVEAER